MSERPDLSALKIDDRARRAAPRAQRRLLIAALVAIPLLVLALYGFLRERFGGGKFKINLHHGMHFVSTKNFRPSGPSRWAELPEVAEE